VSHLEDLLCEYYEWQGYIVRRNIKVGRLGHGGWEGELDLVAAGSGGNARTKRLERSTSDKE